jgi:hypothetical protein
LMVLVSVACTEVDPPTSAKPTINSFTASPASLPAGGGSTALIWDVKDATTLSIDNSVGAVTGVSKTVSVTSNTTFTLTATNASGSATQSTSISVDTGVDTTAPTVVSVDPPDGATGIRNDANLVISFSERMDRTATEAAYQSAGLPTSAVAFSWNTDSTVMTVNPNAPLEYAEGDTPTTAARQYAFRLSSEAKDASGNALAAFSSSFSTLKVISSALYAEADQTGYIEDVGGDLLGISSQADFCVGDVLSDNEHSRKHRH